MTDTTQFLAELYDKYRERGIPAKAAATLAGAFLISRQIADIYDILNGLDDRLMKIAEEDQ